MPAELLTKIQNVFGCGWASEDEVRAAIKSCWDANGYVIDPHTACGYYLLEQMPRDPLTPRVLLSTASPYKFCDSVLTAIGEVPVADSVDRIAQLEAVTGVAAPKRLAALKGKVPRFGGVADRERMEDVVLDFLR